MVLLSVVQHGELRRRSMGATLNATERDLFLNSYVEFKGVTHTKTSPTEFSFRK